MKPLINKKLLLERYPGKGGWTFARIPRITQDSRRPFGYVMVKGTIDGYEIKKFNLMPMSDGQHFMPVKADIRKAIQKEVGDVVHIILYHDTDPLEIPGEMMICLQDEPKALKFFNKLTDSEKKYYIQWVYSAKKEETKISRMAKAINRMSKGLKMYDNAPKDE